MKATGIVRNMDQLGRIVLPKEMRKVLGIETGTPMGIFVDGDSIILRKYEPGCVFCGNVDDDGMKMVHGKLVCPKCRHLIADA